MTPLEYSETSNSLSYTALNEAIFTNVSKLTPGWVLSKPDENSFDIEQQQGICELYHRFYKLTRQFWNTSATYGELSDIELVELYIENYEAEITPSKRTVDKLEYLDWTLFDVLSKDLFDYCSTKEALEDEEAEVTASYLIGFAIAEFYSKEETFFDNADMVVALSAHINGFLSKLHFNTKLDHAPAKLYRMWKDNPSKLQQLNKHIEEKCNTIGMDELLSRTRFYYENENQILHYAYISDEYCTTFSRSYEPSTFSQVNAVCGIDASGKGYLLNLLKEKVAIPIAHLEDSRTQKFLISLGMTKEKYEESLEAFNIMRSRELKANFTLAAYRFVRKLFKNMDDKMKILTAFSGIIFDRSWLTNFAYASKGSDLYDAFLELILTPLNPERIIVIDTPVSVCFGRILDGRDAEDEFDQALFSIHVRRATFYKIFVNVFPNVVALKTFNEKEIIPDNVIEKTFKELQTV